MVGNRDAYACCDQYYIDSNSLKPQYLFFFCGSFLNYLKLTRKLIKKSKYNPCLGFDLLSSVIALPPMKLLQV